MESNSKYKSASEKLREILENAGIKEPAIGHWQENFKHLSFENSNLLIETLSSMSKEEIIEISGIFEKKIKAYGDNDTGLLEKILEQERGIIF